MVKHRNKRLPARQPTATAVSVNTRTQQHTEAQQTHGNSKKMHPQHREFLSNRITRDDQIKPQPQQDVENQAGREQAGANKRKRGEIDDSVRQQKRTCIATDFKSILKSQSAPTKHRGQTNVFKNGVQSSATDLKTLQSMSEEQKMARRRNRFANEPVQHRLLESSKITKISDGSSAASYETIHAERKTAGVESAVASDNIPPSTHGDSDSGQDEGTTIIDQVCCMKGNGNESESAATVTDAVSQAHDAARADSVIQSSPASATNSQWDSDHTSGKMPPHDSTSTSNKVTRNGHNIGLTANANANAQPKDPKGTNKSLRAPRVIINDDRQSIVEPNPEYVLHYKPYDFTSVLLMASFHIAHDEKAEESVDRWYILNQQAMDMYKRPWNSQDFGRGMVNKSLPARIINDCDLYYCDDQKIYVATEMGLLLVADYCKAIGVPDEQPVRFEGRKPKWAKKLEAGRHYRRVELEHPQNNDSFLQPCISLTQGATVEVYERCKGVDAAGIVWNFAYGRRTEDGVTGFFDYGHTCSMDWGKDSNVEFEAPNPNIIDWVKFDYGPGARNAKKYLADLAAGKYAPQSQRRTFTITKAPVAAAAISTGTNVSKTSVSVGNKALTGSQATSAAPASPAITGPVATNPATIKSPANELQTCEPAASPKTAIAPAGDAATAAVEPPSIVVTQPIQRTEMISISSGTMEESLHNESKAVYTCFNESETIDTCLDEKTQIISQASDKTEELGSSRSHSLEPSTNTGNDAVKDITESDTAKQDTSPDVQVTPLPTTTVGTIRRRVGYNEYVEDEIDYDDDDL
ncbi:hypothetical protein J1614_005684 [Plenodomus biglobosus]|nr:hypothetical protein J1614_005684 [Plenodomus biglobosus]